ncbi:MAG: S26 family signal peptidase [Sphingomonadales bacterium]|jgi:conjugal transfer pilin signal peptidase TrbI|nr:S26 family signal peptidase [Sphingomonadales bacterium]
MLLSSSWAQRTLALAGGLSALGAWSWVDAFAHDHLFLVNRTGSLPNWAFFIERQKHAALGDTVFFVPPNDPLVVAHFGREPAPFGKIVYAVAGDEVVHRGNVVLVRSAGTKEWRMVALTKPLSMRGERLEAGPSGTIPPGCLYVGTPHKHGFDSRYKAIGFVCRDRLIGVAKAMIL